MSTLETSKKTIVDLFSADYIKKNAMLGILAEESTLYNPLARIPVQFEDRPELYLVYLMRRPEYMYFFLNQILGLQMMPLHMSIMRDMWQRKFPMLISSRGYGKTFTLGLYSLLRACFLPERKVVVAGAGFRQSKLVFDYIEKFWDKSPRLRSACDLGGDGIRRSTDLWTFKIGGSVISAIPVGDGGKIRGIRAQDLLCVSKETLVQTDKGLIEIQNYLSGEEYHVMDGNNKFEMPTHVVLTPKTDVYEISTTYGMSFKCSAWHRVMTNSGWKIAKDLTNNDYLKIDCNGYFPDSRYVADGLEITDALGWFTGVLVSEGSIANRNQMSIANTDKTLIDRIISRIPELKWSVDYRDKYIDKREFNCKESWTARAACTELRTKLANHGLGYNIHLEKSIPKYILQSPKSVVIEFLRGLFEGDGSGFQFDNSRGVKKFRICYYSSSIKLCKQLQVLLLKFGVVAGLCDRTSKLSTRKQYMLQINSKYAHILYNILQIKKQHVDFDSISYYEKRPNITRKNDRYIVSTYDYGKNVYIGSYDTEKECDDAFDKYWSDNHVYVKLKKVELLPEKEVLYDFHLPEGHSFIGNGFVQHNCDEFHSINENVYEQVMSGFAAVSSDPIKNVERHAYEKFLKIFDKELKAAKVPIVPSQDKRTEDNQLIISGTAYYEWNHFYKYFKNYRDVLRTRGDKKKLQELLNEDAVPAHFNWKNYAIYRIPFSLIPTGFMDAESVARSKAMTHSEVYGMEYESIFCKDSNGFFRRSLVESCVVSERNKHELPCQKIFYAKTVGEPDKTYVYAIDPASQRDNFALVILEVHENHWRVVHCWTTRRKKLDKLIKFGLEPEQEFIAYTARQIRSLDARFPCDAMAIDTQGGGYALIEALRSSANMKEGEEKILPVILPTEQQETDGLSGRHIIYPIQFANAKWTADANHNMKFDLEARRLLFPMFDNLVLENSFFEDQKKREMLGIDDKFFKDSEDFALPGSLEEVIHEIEELKTELSNIVHTATPGGTERWDTPEVKVGAKSVTHMRKDRYSALVMANAIAREMRVHEKMKIAMSTPGGRLGDLPRGVSGPRNELTTRLSNIYSTFYQSSPQD